MKLISRVAIVAVAALFLASGLMAQEMTKDEWQKQITELTAKSNDLKNKVDALTKEIEDLKKQDADKAAALAQCKSELLQLVGADQAAQTAFEADLGKIDGKLSELSRLSDQDLWARKAEIDSVQSWIDAARKNKLALVPKHADQLADLQNRTDALKATVKKLMESGQGMMTYTVGTWARDRDCLWNIAKKPKTYGNPFLWPKIWQGNRDQIKNPDLIYQGQKLQIPAKAELTGAERSALRSYWSKKRSAASNP
jgi:nucleoid-associated protein YgaU